MLCTVGAALGVCRNDDIGKVKREQNDVRRQVEKTSGQLDANRRQAEATLRELNTIDADMERSSRDIERIERNVEACDARIAQITDTMAMTEARLARLRDNYASAVRKMQKNISGDDRLTFILSSSSLHEAWRRMRYLKQFSKWRDRQAEEIHGEIIALERRKKDVEKLRNEQQTRNRALQNAYAGLKQQRDRQKDVVERLKGEEKHLKDVLAEQNSRAEALDRELDRLIRLEEERAAEAARKERERKLAEQEARVKAEKDKADKKIKIMITVLLRLLRSEIRHQKAAKKGHGHRHAVNSDRKTADAEALDHMFKVYSQMREINLIIHTGLLLHNSDQTLKRNRMTSPSRTTYSLPSMRIRPLSRAAA